MKNVHLIPTDKPTRLYKHNELGFELLAPVEHEIGAYNGSNQHIYITSSEEINSDTKSCWCLDTKDNSVNYYQGALPLYNYIGYKKIILTTDQDLIADGVQAIDDNFLEWFVKNPSCEEVKTRKIGNEWIYNADVPQEEDKQETLEKAAEKAYPIFKRSTPFGSKYDWIPKKEREAFKRGAKWQSERSHSNEEVSMILQEFKRYLSFGDEVSESEWFEQFKKK
jgi:hypothetical protein